MLDKWFRPSLGAGAALVAAGGLVRLGGNTFAWALAGQALVAVAQPLVLSAVSKLSGEYLPQRHRATGIAVGSAGSFAGMVIALTLGPTVGAHGQIERLLLVEAVIGVIPAIVLMALLFTPPGHSEEHAAIEGNAVRALWAMKPMKRCWRSSSSASGCSSRSRRGCSSCSPRPASANRLRGRCSSGWCSPA